MDEVIVMETGTIISLCAVLISLIGVIFSGRKETRTDAASSAMVQAKLDSVISGVDDIRIEIRSTKDTLVSHGERLTKVETRLDKLEK